MKFIKKISVLILLMMISCSEEDYSKFEYTFYNSTDFDLAIVPDEKYNLENSEFSFMIKPKETISFSLSGFYGLFDFIPTQSTEKVFDVKYDINNELKYKIINYDYQIKYVVSGSAKRATITYNTSSGGTGQTTRNLPYTNSYKHFGDDWVYLSAQSEDGDGYVKVEIFVEDKLKYSSQAGGFEIATASGSWINLYN